MKDRFSQASELRDRRVARRYPVEMRMEIWPETEPRLPDPTFVSTRDVSLRGVYFFSEAERPVGTKLNFSVLFLREMTGDNVDLISGVARVVSCDLLEADGGRRFGVALAIEETTHLHEG